MGRRKIKEIYEILPQMNCGLCGFQLCGQFARAMVDRNVSPFGCRLKPWLGYQICEIMGLDVPAFGYALQPPLIAPLGDNPTLDDLRDLLGEDP